MSNRVAVVTGGRRGIGQGIAFALADRGHDIVLVDLIEDESTDLTIRGIRDRGTRAIFLQADVADVTKAEQLCQRAFDAFGEVGTLVNNAGVQVQDRSANALRTTVESFDRLFNINLRGTFFLTQAFAQRMGAALPGATGFRSIITISSSNASHAKTTGVEYCMSKSALSMLNKVFALQLAPHGICCYEVQPGLIKTDMNVSMHERYEPVVSMGLTPMPRWGTPQDVGHTVASLACGALQFSTGETLHVDGGLHIPKSLFESPFVKERLA